MIYGSLQVSGFIYYLFSSSLQFIMAKKNLFVQRNMFLCVHVTNTLIVLFFTSFIVHLIKLFNNLKNVIFLVCQKKPIKKTLTLNIEEQINRSYIFCC